MYKFLIVMLVFGIWNASSASVEEKINQYFKSEVFKAFQKHWQAHRKSFENAIQLALKENYGHRGMNVYVRRAADTLRICQGFYVSDSVIEMMLYDITLTRLPHLTMPEVTFALASNALRVEAGLSKMVLETRYLLFRNDSDVIYSKADQDPYKNSPFSYQQVQRAGQLAIVADGCILIGYALVKLSGESINLGHDTFRVRGCKFSVEISSNRYEWPPVIAPYFSQEHRVELETLLTRPIREEMMPKLQAAVFSYINTSVIFGDYLPKFREYQDNIYKDTNKHVNEIVRGINNQTVELNKVTVDLDPLAIAWNFTCQEEDYCWNYALISNVTLHGLDTLYSSHTGGPLKFQEPKISEAFRFNSMMVRGNLYFENNTLKAEHDFVAEIRDLAVNIEIEVNKTEPIIDTMDWRLLELSVIELEQSKERKTVHSFIHGYLFHVIPEALKNHLASLYGVVLNQIKNQSKPKHLEGSDNKCRH